MENGVGKYRHRKIRKSNKPYNRPPQRSVYARVKDTFKSIVRPFAPTWIIGGANTEEEPVQDEEKSMNGDADDIVTQKEPIPVEPTTTQQPVVATEEEVETAEPVAKVVENNGKSTKSIPPSITQLWKNKDLSYPQTSASDIHEPRFNPNFSTLRTRRVESPRSPAIFNTSGQRNSFNTSGYRDSLFYTGPTQFGGALNSSMNNFLANNTSLNSSRYSIPKVQQVKVVPNKRRKVSFINSNASSLAGTPSSSSYQQNAPLSSTAQKILKVMEKLNTPVSDARRIPLSERKGTPYAAVTRSRRRRMEGGLLDQSNNKRKPPVTNGMMSSTPARLHQQDKIPFNHSLISNVTASATALKHKSAKTTPEPEEAAVDAASAVTTTPFKTPQPIVKELPRIGSAGSGGGGGKMKNKRRTHVSAVNNEDEEENPLESHLPLDGAIGLPLTSASKLPKFQFNCNPTSTSTPAAPPPKSSLLTKTSNDDQSETTTKKIFGEPTTGNKISSTSSIINFSFSSPKTKPQSAVVEKEVKKSTAATTKDMPNFLFSKPAIATSDVGKSTDTSTTAPSSAAGDRQNTPATASSSFGGIPSPPTTLKKGSVMDILGKSSTPASTPPAPKPKKWECETCMVRNNDDVTKCVACTALKPGTAPPPSAPSQAKKRVSFGLPKSLETVAGSGSGEKTKGDPPVVKKSSGGKWSCPTCMVNNKEEDLKCVCCSEKKPGSKQADDSAPKFGGVSSSAPSLMFKAPSSSSTAAVASSSTPQFGIKSSASSATPIQFGFATPKSKTSSDDVSSSTSSVLKQQSSSTSRKGNINDWRCDVCMIKNSEDKMKCVACEASNPNASKKNADSSSEGFGFKYGATSENVVKFGISSTTKLGASTTSDESTTAAAAAPKLNFGAPKTTEAPAATSKVNFGEPKAAEPAASAPKFSFGVPKTTEAPKLSFGTPKTTTEAPKINFGGPAATTEAPKLSFGAPATTAAVAAPKFGAATTTPAPTSTPPQFGTAPADTSAPPKFGVTKKFEAQSTTGPKFGGFGTAASSTLTSSADSATSSTTTSKPPSMFGFGSTKTDTSEKPSEAPSFTFGESKAPKAAASSEAAPATTAPASNFFFGKPSANEKPAEATTAPVSKPGFTFGQKPAAAPAPESTKFSGFGTTPSTLSATNSASPAAPSFSFGGKAPSQTPERSNQPFSFKQPPALGGDLGASQPKSMFGASTQQATAATETASAGANIFGGAAAKPAAPSEAAKNLFGSGSSSSTTTGSIFSTKQPSSSTLFGQAPAADKPASTGLFNTAQTNQAPASNMFASNTPKQPSSNSLFGSPAPPNATPFAAATSTTSNASAGFTFGQTPSTTGDSKSMFGAGGASSENKPTTNMFGSAANKDSGGIFGNSKPSTPQKPSMFGSGTTNTMFNQTQQPSSTSAFNVSSTSAAAPFKFGGASAAAQPATGAPSGGNMFAQSNTASSTGFKFGATNNASASPASSGFKFPTAPAQQPSSTGPSSGGFNFTGASKPASNFQFTGGSAFSSPQQPSSAGGFAGFGSGPAAPSGGAPPGGESMFSIGAEQQGLKRSANAQRPVRRAQRRLNRNK